MAAGFDQFCILSSEARESEFVLARPDGAAARVVVDNIVGNETANLGIVVHFSGFVEVVFRPGAAVGHDQRWRVEDTGTGPKLDDIVEERRDGQAVFIAAEAVDRVGQIELHVEAALGCGHHAIFLAGHDHPLALFAIAHEVGFQVGGPIELPVAANDVVSVVERAKVGVGKHAGTGGVGPRADDVASVDQILIGEHVVGGGLRIAPSGNAVGEVGEETPVFEIEHTATDFRPMRVDVDEARNDCLSRNVDDLGAGGNWAAVTLADGNDAVVFDEDVGVFKYFIAVHGDDTRAAQNSLTGGGVARELETDADHFGLQLWRLFLVHTFCRVFGRRAFRCELRRRGSRLSACFLFRSLGRFKLDLIERQAEEGGTLGPGHGFSAIGKTHVVAADLGDLAQGNRGLGDIYGDRLAAHARDRKQVHLVADLGEGPLAVGADADVIGRCTVGLVGLRKPDLADHLHDRAAVRAVVAERHQAVFRIDVDAFWLRAEMGMGRAAGRKNEVGVATVGRQPDQIEIDWNAVPLVELFDAALAGRADGNDALAVRREIDVAIVPGNARKLLGAAAAVGAGLPDLSAFLRPGDVGDPLAVGRPRGHKFASGRGGQAVGRAAGNIHHVKMSECGEDQPLAIR